MKYKINNKLLVVTAISTLFMTGCVSKSITVSDEVSPTAIEPIQPIQELLQEKKIAWGSKNSKTFTKSSKEDCPDCYASIFKEDSNQAPKEMVAQVSTTTYSYDYSNAPKNIYPVNEKEKKRYSNPYDKNNPYLVDSDYEGEIETSDNTYFALNQMASNTRGISAKKSIQVGAFRNYAGAKVYAKRYSLLTNKYGVDIKENFKNNKPIYRVQIEGFATENEAQNFMARYGLNGAFLVRR